MYTYLEILEVDIIKQTKWKKKLNRVSLMNEKTFRKQTLKQESHQTDKHLGYLPCIILETILEVDQRITAINGTEDKKVNDNALGLISERWHMGQGGRELVSIEYSVDGSTRSFEDDIKKGKGRLMTVTRNNTSNIKINRTTISWKKKSEEEKLYVYFKWKTNLAREDVDMAKCSIVKKEIHIKIQS